MRKLAEIVESDQVLEIHRLGIKRSGWLLAILVWGLAAVGVAALIGFMPGGDSHFSFSHIVLALVFMVLMSVYPASLVFENATPCAFAFDRESDRFLINGRTFSRIRDIDGLKLKIRRGTVGHPRFQLGVALCTGENIVLVQTPYASINFSIAGVLNDTIEEQQKYGWPDRWIPYKGDLSGWDQPDNKVFELRDRISAFLDLSRLLQESGRTVD